jgi:hypothetical protein
MDLCAPTRTRSSNSSWGAQVLRRSVKACSYENGRPYREESVRMKNLLVALVACTAGLALADPGNPCNAPASAVKSEYVDLTGHPGKFECAPAPIGSGTMPTVRSNAAGTVAWWYCPHPDGKWHVNWAAATAELLSARNLMSEAHAVLTSKDPKGTFDAIVAKNVSVPLSDPKLTPVWCPFVGEMFAAAPPRIPKAASAPQAATGQVASARVNPGVSPSK